MYPPQCSLPAGGSLSSGWQSEQRGTGDPFGADKAVHVARQSSGMFAFALLVNGCHTPLNMVQIELNVDVISGIRDTGR